MIGHADRLSMGSRVRVDGGKGQECLDYDEGDWQLAKWVGLCVLCVLCARWTEVRYRGTTSLTVTQDERREFPPEQTLHPPLAAALS